MDTLALPPHLKPRLSRLSTSHQDQITKILNQPHKISPQNLRHKCIPLKQKILQYEFYCNEASKIEMSSSDRFRSAVTVFSSNWWGIQRASMSNSNLKRRVSGSTKSSSTRTKSSNNSLTNLKKSNATITQNANTQKTKNPNQRRSSLATILDPNFYTETSITIKQKFLNFYNTYFHTLWEKQIFKVESLFGNVARSYFVFHKWLVLNNLLTFLALFSFIVLPEVIFKHYFDWSYPEYPNEEMVENAKYTTKVNKITLEKHFNWSGHAEMEKTVEKVTIHHKIKSKIMNITLSDEENCFYEANNPFYDNSTDTFNNITVLNVLQSIISGGGILQNTPIFLGYYQSVNVQNYDIKMAIVLVPLFIILVNAFLLTRKVSGAVTDSIHSHRAIIYEASTGTNQRQYQNQNSSETVHVYDSKNFAYFLNTFASWDYSISDPSGINLQKSSILITFKSLLNEQKHKKQINQKDKTKILIIRIVINFLVLLLIIGSACLIFWSTIYSLTELANLGSEQQNTWLELFYQYLPSLVISLINWLGPIIFNGIRFSDIEYYVDRRTINLALLRTITLRYISIIVLIISIYMKINCQNFDLDFSNISKFNEICQWCEGAPCWESLIGQEMYKLTILIVLFMFLRLLLLYVLKLYVKYCTCCDTNVEDQELVNDPCLTKFVKKILLRFDVIKDVLEVVYLQVVTWIGSFFSPLLPMITVLALISSFYLKIHTLQACITRESIEIHAYSKHGWFFFAVLSAGFICSSVIILYSIGFITPSVYCGPFQFFNTSQLAGDQDESNNEYQVGRDLYIKDSMWNLAIGVQIQNADETAGSILAFLGSSGGAVTIGILLILLLGVVVKIFFSQFFLFMLNLTPIICM